MKALLLLVLILVVGVMAYQKKDLLTLNHATAATDLPETQGSSAAEPALAAAPQVPAVTLADLEQLAEDDYYTRVRVTEVKENGIAGIAAAQPVKLLGRDGSRVTIKNGLTVIQTTSDKITRDANEILKLLEVASQN